MPYVPFISDYQPFYLQRESDPQAIDVQQRYGITVVTHDYPATRQVKQPYKNDWKDEHGDDEYTGNLFYEAFTFTADCCIITEEDDSEDSRQALKDQLRSFQNDFSCAFKCYDAWTRFGFRDVRFDRIGDFKFTSWHGHSRLLFTITFKVNDPMTEMSLSDGSIEAEE